MIDEYNRLAEEYLGRPAIRLQQRQSMRRMLLVDWACNNENYSQGWYIGVSVTLPEK